jgi:hypothetical protein
MLFEKVNEFRAAFRAATYNSQPTPACLQGCMQQLGVKGEFE